MSMPSTCLGFWGTMDSTEAVLKEARHGSIDAIRTTETSDESEGTYVMLKNSDHAQMSASSLVDHETTCIAHAHHWTNNTS